MAKTKQKKQKKAKKSKNIVGKIKKVFGGK